MSTEIDFSETYTCPHCRADLAYASKGWSGWLRCPVCGLASLPPEPESHNVPVRHRAGPVAPADILEIRDPDGDAQTNADALRTQVTGRLTHTSPTRLIFKTGLLASVALAFVAFLDHRTTHARVFGCLSFVFLLLVLGGPGSRPSRTVLTAKRE
jgi:hypothetical protein